MLLLKDQLMKMFCIATFVLTLVGCSGEPSNADITKSMSKLDSEVVSARKISCIPQDIPQGGTMYLCDVEVEIISGGLRISNDNSEVIKRGTRLVGRQKYFFLKTKNGWGAFPDISGFGN